MGLMTQQTERRPDASMSLLTNLLTHTLDGGYADAARRREARGLPPARPGWLLALGLVVVGAVLAVSAVQAHDRLPAAEKARAELLAQVQQRTQSVDAMQNRLDTLRSGVAKARKDALAYTSAGQELSARLAQLELVSGAAPVVGPGLQVTLDDAKDVGASGSGDIRQDGAPADGVVRDRDLQQVVNGLWAAGAEAMAINGHRLTSLTAIRAAGSAILVDFRPLAPPYVVSAIGDPARLESGFAGNAGGAYLQALASNYGIQTDVARAQDLTLPGASGFQLRYATVPPEATPLSTSGSSPSGSSPPSASSPSPGSSSRPSASKETP